MVIIVRDTCSEFTSTVSYKYHRSYIHELLWAGKNFFNHTTTIIPFMPTNLLMMTKFDAVTEINKCIP